MEEFERARKGLCETLLEDDYDEDKVVVANATGALDTLLEAHCNPTVTHSDMIFVCCSVTSERMKRMKGSVGPQFKSMKD